MSRTIHTFNFRALILWVSVMSMASMLVMPCTPAAAQFDGFAGRWTMDWQGNGVGTLTLTQSGRSVSGSFSTKLINGKVFGTVSVTSAGTEFSGRWTTSRDSGLVWFYLPVNNGAFRGNTDGKLAWCGWRSTSVKPTPCLRTSASAALRK